MPQEIPVAIHNGSTYHFLIKELAEEFKGEFECLGENTEKHISFSVPIKKEYDNDNDKTITCKLKFIVLEDFCEVKYQTLLITCLKLIIKIGKHAWTEKNIKSECDLIGFKNNRLNYRCKECKGTSSKSINE